MSRQIINIARFCLFVLGVTAVLSLTVHAAPTFQELPHPRFNLEEIPHQQATNTGSPPESALSVTAPDALLPWSKVAFQSFRNGTWDIFVGNDDGSGQTAVVSTGSAEIHPHLNRGNTKIVYASSTGGDFEITTVNFDGSGKTALTNNNTNDGNPSWSPDGSKIVFEAYRNGEADIYVMNANGSNQVRLTTDPDFDGMPSWSPDGSKIAFVSRRTGGYRIYVMNADGSGQTQISNQHYSFRPQWSPDGSQIAYDADNDGDGWQDLWRMNADGTSQTMIYNPSGQTDAWTSSWSPDGKRIVYTLISFIYYQGNWYWTTAYLETWGVGIIRLSSSSVDWDASWQTSDNLSPGLNLKPIPLYSRNPLALNWDSVDVGGADIKNYDVQYRNVNSTNWSNLSPGLADPLVDFSGTAGQTYQFRVRAVDKAFNYSQWQYNFQTTIYNWSISGLVTDNRGNPITNATTTTSPTSFETHSSDFLGFFQSFVGGIPDAYSASWLKTGYGNLPTTSYSPSQDATVNIALPPADNVLSNWGFEDGSLGETGNWQIAGLTSLLTTETNHTGTHSVLMGELALPEPTNISNSPDAHSATPKIVTTEDRVTHIIWSEATTSNPEATIPEIRYINIAPDGTSSVPQTISVPGNSSYFSTLQADKNGKLHVAWLQKIGSSYYVYYAQRDETGNWSTPLSISQVNIGFAKPQIKLGDSGIVYLVWNDRQNNQDIVAFSQRETNGTWSSPTAISSGSVSIGSFTIGLDYSEGIHVVWNELSGPNIVATYRPNAGSWTNPIVVSGDNGFKGTPALTIDSSGKPHVVWTNDNNDPIFSIYYATRNLNGTWTTPLKLSGNGASINNVRIAAAGDGKLHVMWQQADGIRYILRNSNGNWGTIQTIQSIHTLPSFFQVDDFGVLHIAWREFTQDPNANYFHYTTRSTDNDWATPVSFAGPLSSLSDFNVSLGTDGSLNFVWNIVTDDWLLDGEVYFTRTKSGAYTLLQNNIVIPLSVVNPTLSFFVKPTTGNNSDKIILNAVVTNGTESQIFPVTNLESEIWSHHWFDLSEWQDEVIELSINYETTSATALQGVYLDEITLGSAFADIEVQIDGPSEALRGSEVTYTVSYENHSSIDANEVVLTAVLPSHLTYLNASSPPTSQSPTLTWNIGDLPANSGTQSLTFTARVKNSTQGLTNAISTVNVSTTTTELETLNNSSDHSLFIGMRTYMPLISKN